MELIERRKLAGEVSKGTLCGFEATILPHRAALNRTAVQFTRNATEAEDLVQRTLIQAFTHWHTFRAEPGCYSTEGSQARAWLQAILRNLFLNDFNRQKRKRGREISLEDIGEDSPVTSRGIPLSSVRVGMTPEQATLRQEELRALRKAMNRLPETYSTILVMAVEEGMLYNEIAVRLNLPIGTVRSRLHRARKRIQRAVSAG